ncbi:hypothetical protein FRC18_005391 [Serendipita sp. 400]|nr:hypothetical protein FRC18_005391 [Serendipita sp. 400]
MHFISLFTVLVLAVGVLAEKHLYRVGNASKAVAGTFLRPNDVGTPHADGKYHPGLDEHGNHLGISTYANPADLDADRKAKVWMLHPSKIVEHNKNHPDHAFTLHDDGHRSNPPHSHHTISPAGPHDADRLHGHFNGLGWAQMTLQEAIAHHARHNPHKRSVEPADQNARSLNRVQMVHEAIQASKRAAA